MAQIENIVQLLEAGAKAEGLRQKAVASNIANQQTPDYRRVDVRFEELLAEAMESGQGDLEDIQPELFQPKQTPVNAKGNDVSFEDEVGQLIENSIRHKTFMRLLSKKYRQMELAMEVRD